jgi:arylsulfatase A-like enzyme
MRRRWWAFVAVIVVLVAAPAGAKPRNIVLILTDDLGYGDVGCYGATKVKTPNVDRLAAAGLRFTDGHCTSATCTPSRYALLTGEYPWRKKGTNVLPGDAALIIEPGRPTLPSVLKRAGYTTGVIGKWHLGLGRGNLDWNGVIKPGPLEVGFDYAFVIPATGDRVPCVFVEDHSVVGLDPADPIRVSYQQKVGDDPTGREHPEKLKVKLSEGHDATIVNGISRIGYMSGGKAARWVDEDIADTLTRKAVSFVERNKDKPFFLYFATHDVHVPRAPNARFAGTSGCGTRGDVIQQMDWCVGQVLEALDRLKLTDNTLVIFTSDNGPVLDDGYADGAVEHLNGHTPAGPWRGGKYTPYEGGTRVPLVVRWPGHVKPGTTSDALVCQVDLMHSVSKLCGQELTADAGPDSFDVLPALLGQSEKGRDDLVEQGGPLALRQGKWKLVTRPGAPRPEGRAELYDLKADPGERINLAGKEPSKVKVLTALLNSVREKGRSRP